MELQQLIEDYLRDAVERVGYSPGTCKTFGTQLRVLCAWFAEQNGRPMTAADLTASVVQMHDTAYKRAGRAQSTRAGKVCAAVSLARWLKERGHIDLETLVDIQKVKIRITEKPRQIWASADQVRALFAACAHVKERHSSRLDYRPELCAAVLAVLAYTGLRRAEVCSLMLTDIHLGDGPYVKVRQGKGDKSRIVPLCRDAVVHLRAWIARRPEGTSALFAIPVWHKVWEDGKQRRLPRGKETIVPMNEDRMIGVIAELCKIAGLDKTLLAPHAFRRFSATNLLSIPGATLKHVQDFLGHSQLISTIRYVGSDAAELRRLVENISLSSDKQSPPAPLVFERSPETERPAPPRRFANASRETGPRRSAWRRTA